MSEQGKSNLQAFGAGAAAFGAVVVLGGAALMAYSRFHTSAPAVPAAAPIDLSRHSEAPAAGREHAARESRAESPAPLIGDEELADESAATAAAPAAAPAPAQAASAAPAASSPQAAEAVAAATVKAALEKVQAIGASGATTSAEAKLAAVEPAKKPEAAALTAAPAAKKFKTPRLELKGDAVASTIQYGGTDRSRLMGRAAGPVYNFKGSGGGASQAARMPGASGKATTAATAAAPAGAALAQDQVDAVKKTVDATALSAEEKRLIQAELEKAGQAVAPAR